jgi:hypothetical protein
LPATRQWPPAPSRVSEVSKRRFWRRLRADRIALYSDELGADFAAAPLIFELHEHAARSSTLSRITAGKLHRVASTSARNDTQHPQASGHCRGAPTGFPGTQERLSEMKAMCLPTAPQGLRPALAPTERSGGGGYSGPPTASPRPSLPRWRGGA